MKVEFYIVNSSLLDGLGGAGGPITADLPDSLVSKLKGMVENIPAGADGIIAKRSVLVHAFERRQAEEEEITFFLSRSGAIEAEMEGGAGGFSPSYLYRASL